MSVSGIEGTEARLRLHPTKDLGERSYLLGSRLYIGARDAARLDSCTTARLKGLCTVRLYGRDAAGALSAEAITGHAGAAPDSAAPTIQWVPANNCADCTVMIPGPLLEEGHVDGASMRVSRGLIESFAMRLDQHEVVQLERFGFCILDDKEAMRFIFITR